MRIENMGYQESYVTTKNKKDFEKLVDYFKKNKLWLNNDDSISLVEIITLNKEIKGDYYYMCHPETTYKFCKGTKFLYFVGERYAQRSYFDLFDLENIEPSDEDMKWIKDVKIIFTECFPSEEIFGEHGHEVIATHEEFIFDNDNEEE
jgi:hypothetical protein